ncbi:Hypothetical predicted protein [Octopus vulgaris]|uniref:Uncharacterized protein n=1 Tax=Octopus vulgaris TaxID=6645 RepID=A0AA36ANZ3_OCTVU|nr:Hypothetical predicted protein [Octopus vulgaris]
MSTIFAKSLTHFSSAKPKSIETIISLRCYFLKPGDTSETQDMSSETPPANATDRQHNGGAHVEDSPETNKNSEANVNYEDYLEMVLNVENGIEDMDKSRKKKKRKSKQQKESQADENDDTVIAETEENDDEGISKKKKRRRSKKHGSIAEENEESNTGDVVNKDNDVDEVDGEVAVKKKKKKHKKHKKDEEEVEEVEEEEEEILQNDAEVKLERSMDVGDGDYAVSSDDASKGNNKIKERQKKEKEENEKSKFLISRNREQTWPKEDVLRLLVSLQNNLSDTTKIKTEELWERVQFDSYTPEDCKAMYTAAVAKVRKIRTMLEIVKDAIRILPIISFSITAKQ